MKDARFKATHKNRIVLITNFMRDLFIL